LPHCRSETSNFYFNVGAKILNYKFEVKRRFHGGFTSVARSGLAWLWKSGFQFSFSWWLATSRQPHLRACAIGRASVELFDHIYLLRGCLIPCLPRVPKKATQCVPECCILYFYRRNKTSFFSFHKNYLEKKREKNKRKTRTDNVNHNHRFTDLQMSIVKALTIDHAQTELVQVV
jgi:hypothetical protein